LSRKVIISHNDQHVETAPYLLCGQYPKARAIGSVVLAAYLIFVQLWKAMHRTCPGRVTGHSRPDGNQ
jgi:hypothetical protein